MMTGRSETANLEGRRILVLEDEFFIADDIERALAERGAEVIGPIANCGDALELLRRPDCRIDLAILDINLGGELCFPVADALTEERVPFVFSTGYEDTVVPERFRHVVRWEKPFDLSGLVRSLDGLG